MILKALQPDTGKWFYYDNVRLFKVRRGAYDPKQTLAEGEISLLSSKLEDLPTYVAMCDVVFESGKALTVIFKDEGYLLNDTGQTIEKIM